MIIKQKHRISDRKPEKMDIYTKPGAKVIFTGCSEEQKNFGSYTGDYDKLFIGKVYTIKRIEIHNYHTKVYIKHEEGSFNSVCFEDYKEARDNMEQLTKEQFLNDYFRDISAEDEKYVLKRMILLPCDCDSDDCKGWAMVNKNKNMVINHLNLYYFHEDIL